MGGNHLSLHVPFILLHEHLNLMTLRCFRQPSRRSNTEEFKLFYLIISEFQSLSFLSAACRCAAAYAAHALPNSHTERVYFSTTLSSMTTAFTVRSKKKQQRCKKQILQNVILKVKNKQKKKNEMQVSYLPKPSEMFVEINIVLHSAGPSYCRYVS